MNKCTHGPLFLTAVLWAACGMAPSPVEAIEPAWRFYKPTNTGIPGDYVHTIYVDEHDHPWVAAYLPFYEEGGMAHWDGEVWTTVTNVDYPIIASPRFKDIIKDADGIMWIATDAGLLRMDPDVGPDSLQRYDQYNTPMPASQIAGIDVDPDGRIWLAIHDVNDIPSGGLARFDPDAGTWDVWTTASGLPWGSEWPGWDWVDFVASAPDAGGGYTIWFGSSEMGMATWKDGVFFWYGNAWPPDDPLTPMALTSNDPVDELGNIWMKTWSGLVRRSPDGTVLLAGSPTGSVSRVYAASGGRAFLSTYDADTYLYDDGWIYLGNWGSGDHTYAFAEDSTGTFWTGGIGGAARLEDGSWQRYRVTNTGMIGFGIGAMDFDAAGNVYMNGNAAPGVGGFNVFDGARWTCVNDLNYGLGPPWGFPTDDVAAVCVRSSGLLALAPAGTGVVEWDGFFYTTLLPGWVIGHLAEDGLGRLWAATGYGNAFLIDDEGGWTHFTADNSPLPNGSIGTLIADEAAPGWVWIAAQFGIAHTNGVEWTVYPRELLGLDQNTVGWHITCVAAASDGMLWVGSGLGLFHFDPVSLEYVVYTPGNTTLPTDDIWHIMIAPDESVWIGAYNHANYPYPGGLTRYDGSTWTTWTTDNSPLPHNRVAELVSRAVPGGYEVWVGAGGEGIAVMNIAAGVPGDVDGDGVVGILDFLALLAAWGPCGNCGDCPADFDADCHVGITDLLILLANWTG